MTTMTTMSAQRPSTPFPHTHNTHILTHGHSASYFHYSPEPYVHGSQPLHFAMRSMPVHTPPSLLHRTSSARSTSSSSASATASASSSRRTHARTTSELGLPPMPELVHPIPRRVSSSSASTSSSTADSASPPMPTTPVLGSPLAAPPTPLALPPPAYPKQQKQFSSFTSQSPLAMFNYDPFSTTTSDGIQVASYFSSTTPVRPKMKRRDTPRPRTTTLSSLGMSDISLTPATEEEKEARQVLRSVIDGGRWVILG